MRKIMFGGFLFLVFIHSAQAQSRDPAAFLTGFSPGDLKFQKIEPPKMTALAASQPDTFSFKRYFSKVLGLNAIPSFQPISTSSNLPGIYNRSPLVPSSPQQSLPTTSFSSPLKPMLPTTKLPSAQNTSPFIPLLPTTTLPPAVKSPIQPLPPIIPK
jgi:hypothetical protein